MNTPHLNLRGLDYALTDTGAAAPPQHPDAVNALLGDWLADCERAQGSISIASP